MRPRFLELFRWAVPLAALTFVLVLDERPAATKIKPLGRNDCAEDLAAAALAGNDSYSAQPTQSAFADEPRQGATRASGASQGQSAELQSSITSSGTQTRPVSVADAIKMTRVAGSGITAQNYTGSASSDFAVFSPDLKRFVIVVKRGNLAQNTNEYSMLLFETPRIYDAQTPKTLMSIASSSNNEGITHITWLTDNDTILFLGEHSGETAQLYSLKCTSGKVTQLSHLPRNVVAYSSSATGEEIVVAMENPTKDLFDAAALRDGIPLSGRVVSTEQYFYNLVVGRAVECCEELFLLRKGVERPKALHVHDALWESPLELFLSPDGGHLVVKTIVRDVPALWEKYTADDVKRLIAFAAKGTKGALTYFRRYELIDTQTDISHYLLDSPVNLPGSEVGWSSDSRSVIVTGVYLPLNVEDSAELAARQSHMFTVEVGVPTLEILTLADHDMKFIGWDGTRQHPLFRSSRSALIGASPEVHSYQKRGSRWELMAGELHEAIQRLPEITVEQDLNTSPRVIAADLQTGKRATLLDLNPEFHNLRFGNVEEVKWAGGGGKEFGGGLYLPPQYVRGKRYPLVIQTHGFDSHGFWIDGPFTTAFAAQPLAGKEIVVLQVPDSHDSMQTPEEAPLMMETYERAIDYLDARGIIDRTRVGIIGFSRTCLYVKYTLTHSRYHFAAASVADGVDGGYFQYVAGRNNPVVAALSEQLMGALPFGDGLSLWQQRSPGFLLDKVDAPVRIEAHGRYDTGALQGEWEWYSGLARLGKPVELIYLPDGAHVLEKPWERMVSQQGNVDWFCFWLKGEEDPDPAKAEQYARWRELRQLQEESEKKTPVPPK
jgi:hypothetical protein